MRETIVIQLGNRGANIGSSFWRQISAEHGIENHSFVQQQAISDTNSGQWKNYFHEQDENKILPRSVVIDLESNRFDEDSDMPFRQYPDYIETEDNYVKLNNREAGKLRSEELSQIESVIRKQIERCDSLGQCIFIRDSTEDTSVIMSDFNVVDIGIRRQWIFDFTIVADRNSTDKQMINSILSQHHLVEYSTNVIMYQDTAIQRQVHSKNQHSKVDLNRFVAKTLSNLTEAERFNNSNLRIPLYDISALDDYPRLSFTIPSFVTTFDNVSMPCEIDPSPQSLIENAIHSSSLLCDIDVSVGKYTRAHLFVRGLQKEEIRHDIQRLIQMKKFISFVSRSSSGINAAQLQSNNNNSPIKSDLFRNEDRSVCAAILNTSIRSIFQLWCDKMTRLKTNQSLQRLLDRNKIEKDVFNEALDDLNSLVIDFTEVEERDDL